MASICLHIGYPKSGTTTVQAFLAANTAALAECGVIYPQIGRTAQRPAHHGFAYDILDGGTEIVRAVSKIARENPGSVVLISSEALAEAAPERVRAALPEVPVRVMAYRRDSAQCAVSNYKQATKHGHNLEDFDAFAERWLEGEAATWADRLGTWGRVFGSENVRVRSTAPEVLEGGDVIGDLLSALGVPVAARSGLTPVPPQNISPGWRALELMRSLARTWTADAALSPEAARKTAAGPLRKALVAAEAEHGLYAPGDYLNAAQIRRFVDAHARDRAVLADFGLDAAIGTLSVADLAPREFLPEADAIEPAAAAILLRAAVAALGEREAARRAEQRPRRQGHAAARRAARSDPDGEDFGR